MSSLFAIIVVSTLFIASGWFLTRILGLLHLTERLGLSLLLGAGLSTLIWYWLYLAGINFSFISLIISMVIVTTIGLLLSHLAPPTSSLSTPTTFSTIDRVLLGVIILGIVLAFVISSYNIITAWDSMALYDFRAHAIVLNHDLRDIVDSSYYLSYPLFVSLTHAAIYFVGGVNAQGMHSILFVAFLAVIYGRLTTWTSHRVGLLGVLLTLFTYELMMHSTIAYANLPYSIFLTVGMFYAVSESARLSGRYLIFAGIFLGLSTWVRTTEVFWVIGLIYILWYGYQLRLIKHAILGILLFFLIRQSWIFYYGYLVAHLAVPPLAPAPILSAHTLTSILHNIPQIIEYISKNVLGPYLGFWGMTIGIFVLSFRLSLPRARALALIPLITFALSTIGIAIYSTFFPTWFAIGDSARRMLLFLMPLIYAGALLACTKLLKPFYDQT